MAYTHLILWLGATHSQCPHWLPTHLLIVYVTYGRKHLFIATKPMNTSCTYSSFLSNYKMWELISCRFRSWLSEFGVCGGVGLLLGRWLTKCAFGEGEDRCNFLECSQGDVLKYITAHFSQPSSVVLDLTGLQISNTAHVGCCANISCILLFQDKELFSTSSRAKMPFILLHLRIVRERCYKNSVHLVKLLLWCNKVVTMIISHTIIPLMLASPNYYNNPQAC